MNKKKMENVMLYLGAQFATGAGRVLTRAQ